MNALATGRIAAERASADSQRNGVTMRAIQRPKRRLGWRATAIMAAILAIAATGIAVPGQAFAAPGAPAGGPTPPPGGHCSQVDIIGARGSGQAFDTSGPFKGYGPEVYKAITIIEGDLHAKHVSYGAEPVNYPALSTSILNPPWYDFVDWPDYENNHLGRFMAGIATGVNQTVNYAKWAQQTCHNSKIILVGYSQGAMVVHQAELQLKTKDRAAFNLIIGTVLVADGNRHGNTKAKEFGSSPADGSGIETWFANTLNHFTAFPDVPVPGTTANICNNNDLVCDTSLWALKNFGTSGKVHTTSYANCNSKSQCSYGAALISGASWVGKVAASKA